MPSLEGALLRWAVRVAASGADVTEVRGLRDRGSPWRRRQPAQPLLEAAAERVARPPSPQADVFVHGDLWQGNALWTGSTLGGLVDWDGAGAGPPGVDLGSLRCDAAICFGIDAAGDVQRGWE